MDSGFICGDVIDAAVLFAEMSSDLICNGESGGGRAGAGGKRDASGEPGMTTPAVAAAAVLVGGFWDQLGSTLICQLSLTALACIRGEITLSKQAGVRRVGSVTRRSSFDGSPVSENSILKR